MKVFLFNRIVKPRFYFFLGIAIALVILFIQLIIPEFWFTSPYWEGFM